MQVPVRIDGDEIFGKHKIGKYILEVLVTDLGV